MVNKSADPLDRVFAALADRTRRELLARLADGASRSISELAQPFGISLPAVMKHLEVLSAAGLVTRSKTGRVVACTLETAPMREARSWLDTHLEFWNAGFDRLQDQLEKDARQPNPTSPSPSPSSDASAPRRKKSGPHGRSQRR
jgi:DNA-binding transcriptional ArsR family regulator